MSCFLFSPLYINRGSFSSVFLKVFQGEVNQDSDYRISMERFGAGLYFIVLEDEAGQGYGKKIWKE